ncbi:MAG: hypothetical protein RR413_02740 [Christensenellaceae bacterium]
MKKSLYQLYRKWQYNRFFSSLTLLLYLYVYPIFQKWFYQKRYDQPMKKDGIRIAFICDEMTFRGFEFECSAVFVTPANWKNVLKKFQPEILFCESAWSGIDAYQDCWRGRIYRNSKVGFETRGIVFRILRRCKRLKIPTIFWNKEDPTFFGDAQHDFVDTALYFDNIFTTAQECVERYRALGHKQVETMMFAVQPRLFFPLPPEERDWDTAVFAGSWYADQPQRCKDCCDIFDMVLAQGLKLVIYDRGYYSSDPNRRFPVQYAPYIQPPIPYTQLAKEVAKAGYAININTVQGSETMFARRVFEWMACEVMIISNQSVGMEKLFPQSVWFFKKQFDFSRIKEFCQENRRRILQEYTMGKQLQRVLSIAQKGSNT